MHDFYSSTYGIYPAESKNPFLTKGPGGSAILAVVQPALPLPAGHGHLQVSSRTCQTETKCIDGTDLENLFLSLETVVPTPMHLSCLNVIRAVTFLALWGGLAYFLKSAHFVRDRIELLTGGAPRRPNVIYIQHESLSGAILLNTAKGRAATPFFQERMRNDPRFYVFRTLRTGRCVCLERQLWYYSADLGLSSNFGSLAAATL